MEDFSDIIRLYWSDEFITIESYNRLHRKLRLHYGWRVSFDEWVREYFLKLNLWRNLDIS